ncbi:MAG: hypothetical protein LBK58_06275 [Prevotellaceae bacterium]|jgi:hypothetical protein|nr:hypothetical protein [Prevotellaceae bacterium]
MNNGNTGKVSVKYPACMKGIPFTCFRNTSGAPVNPFAVFPEYARCMSGIHQKDIEYTREAYPEHIGSIRKLSDNKQ